MNKIIRIVTVFCLFAVVLGAGRPLWAAGDTVSALIVRGSLFMPSEQWFKDIYGSSLTVLGGELRFGGKNIGVWIEGGYLSKDGKLSLTEEATKLQLLAAEGGLMYRYCLMDGKICPYVGAGAGFYMYKEESDALGEAKQNKVGFCGMAGIGLQLLAPLLIDLKVKFSSCTMQPDYYEFNVGGISLSAGLGFKF